MENLESWINKQASKLQLSIKETAEFIGKGQQYVRMGLQTRRLKFGSAVQTREPTRTRPRGAWDYDIQRIQVERYVGMSYKKFLELKYICKLKKVMKSEKKKLGILGNIMGCSYAEQHTRF